MKVEVSILGMHCESCSHAVEEGLRRLAGVREASVQIGKAQITFDDSVTDKASILASIRNAGSFEIAGFSTISP